MAILSAAQAFALAVVMTMICEAEAAAADVVRPKSSTALLLQGSEQAERRLFASEEGGKEEKARNLRAGRQEEQRTSQGGGGLRRQLGAKDIGRCEGEAFQGLETCFQGQPEAFAEKCYDFDRVPVDPEKAEPWNQRVSARCNLVEPSSAGGGLAVCTENLAAKPPAEAAGWAAAGPERSAPRCSAPPKTAWRLRNQASSTHGWWVYQVEFHEDPGCRKPLILGRDAEVLHTFAGGVLGEGTSDPEKAFNRDTSSYWRAPCASEALFDMCGCRSDQRYGWSSAEGRCVQGELTDGKEEDACMRKRQEKELGPQTDSPSAAATKTQPQRPGCSPGAAHIGVLFARPLEVGCVRLLQLEGKGLNMDTVALETWDPAGSGEGGGGTWREVKRWGPGLGGNKAGSWESLHVFEECPVYAPPAGLPYWVEVVGETGGRHKGATRHLGCPYAKSSAVVVACSEGQWNPPVNPSAFTGLSCSPEMAQDSAPGGEGSEGWWLQKKSPTPPENEETDDPAMSMLQAVGGFFLVVVALVGVIYLARHALRYYHTRQALLKKKKSQAEKQEAEATNAEKKGYGDFLPKSPGEGRHLPTPQRFGTRTTGEEVANHSSRSSGGGFGNGQDPRSLSEQERAAMREKPLRALSTRELKEKAREIRVDIANCVEKEEIIQRMERREEAVAAPNRLPKAPSSSGASSWQAMPGEKPVKSGPSRASRNNSVASPSKSAVAVPKEIPPIPGQEAAQRLPFAGSSAGWGAATAPGTQNRRRRSSSTEPRGEKEMRQEVCEPSHGSSTPSDRASSNAVTTSAPSPTRRNSSTPSRTSSNKISQSNSARRSVEF